MRVHTFLDIMTHGQEVVHPQSDSAMRVTNRLKIAVAYSIAEMHGVIQMTSPLRTQATQMLFFHMSLGLETGRGRIWWEMTATTISLMTCEEASRIITEISCDA